MAFREVRVFDPLSRELSRGTIPALGSRCGSITPETLRGRPVLSVPETGRCPVFAALGLSVAGGHRGALKRATRAIIRERYGHTLPAAVLGPPEADPSCGSRSSS